jgi:dienelactone hydrolase
MELAVPRFSRPVRGLAALLGFYALAAGQAFAIEPEKIAFPSNNPAATPLDGYLYRPAGTGPFPAVVAMHGCAGVVAANGRVRNRDADWAQRFVDHGIAVLFPDSFNPRGVSSVCRLKSPDRPVVPFGRSADAAGAADWLAAQSYIDRSRIGLIGWSHGGSTVLWTVRRGAAPTTTDFKTAIAFYPGCRVPLARDSWTPRLPLKILMGSADDWTPPQPCRDLASKHGVPMVEYPDAYHGFDSPGVPVRVMKGLAFTAQGNGEAHIGTDETARGAAIAEVMATFQQAFGMSR